MKKLMIAAAVAAMGVVTFADTAYTFTASLKTTKGKSGKETVTYNLGKCANGEQPEWADGEFWYNTPEFAEAYDAKPSYFSTKTIGKKVVPVLTSAAKKDLGFLFNTLKIADLALYFGEKSAGKYCDTVKVTGSGCYRVAGTKKITDIVVGDLCCSSLAGDTVNVTATFSHLFGGLTSAKATKAELYAEVGDDETGFDGYAAGQGKVGKILDNDGTDIVTVYGISSISGNIVGQMNPTKCTYCCTPDEDAIAFECGALDGDYTLNTAAYGTFSLKYNAKATKALDSLDEVEE